MSIAVTPVRIPVSAETPKGRIETEVGGIWGEPASGAARGVVVLAHGAGAGMGHPFMAGFAEALAGLGYAVLRFDFPYMEAGKKFPDRPPLAVGTWRSVLAYAAERQGTTASRVWAAGKSFGARMASVAAAGDDQAAGMETAGLIYLGYPLHPPGKPEKLRDAHLYGIGVPQLFVEGTRDTFARTDLMQQVVDRLQDSPAGGDNGTGVEGSRVELEWIEDADHSFNIKGRKRPPEECGASLAPIVDRFISG
ncbi:alpha/beta hydrolase family protein [Zhihengliuella salsuginis]|nr:alpha/beta family hydrolase [Zhihengliuella salsuginis]